MPNTEFTTDLGFNPSILETVREAYAEKPKMPERIKLLGVRLILDPQLFGRTTTREIAQHLETTESTLFRYVAKPVRVSVYNQGLSALFDEHRAPRYTALKSFAMDLIGARELDALEAAGLWTRAYAKTANPGYIAQALPIHGDHGKEMRDTNAKLMDDCLGAIVATRGERIPEGLGLQLTPLLSALDATPAPPPEIVNTDFPGLAEKFVLDRLTA